MLCNGEDASKENNSNLHHAPLLISLYVVLSEFILGNWADWKFQVAIQ